MVRKKFTVDLTELEVADTGDTAYYGGSVTVTCEGDEPLEYTIGNGETDRGSAWDGEVMVYITERMTTGLEFDDVQDIGWMINDQLVDNNVMCAGDSTTFWLEVRREDDEWHVEYSGEPIKRDPVMAKKFAAIFEKFFAKCEAAAIDGRGHQGMEIMMEVVRADDTIDFELWYPLYLACHWGNDVMVWSENLEEFSEEAVKRQAEEYDAEMSEIDESPE